jgi:hypothetical protein
MELKEQKEIQIQKYLSQLFDKLLAEYKDTPETRLLIVQYTMGYMGASFGLKVGG